MKEPTRLDEMRGSTEAAVAGAVALDVVAAEVLQSSNRCHCRSRPCGRCRRRRRRRRHRSGLSRHGYKQHKSARGRKWVPETGAMRGSEGIGGFHLAQICGMDRLGCVTAKIWGKFARAVGGEKTSFLPEKSFSGSFSIVLGDALKDCAPREEAAVAVAPKPRRRTTPELRKKRSPEREILPSGYCRENDPQSLGPSGQ
jgi:hypothetical protein